MLRGKKQASLAEISQAGFWAPTLMVYNTGIVGNWVGKYSAEDEINDPMKNL